MRYIEVLSHSTHDRGFTWKSGFGWCNEIKGGQEGGTSSNMTGALIRWRDRDTQGGHVMTEAEAGVTQLQAEDHQGAPATTRAGERKGRTAQTWGQQRALPTDCGASKPSRALDFRLPPARPWQNLLLLFEATQSVAFCYRNSRTPKHPHCRLGEASHLCFLQGSQPLHPILTCPCSGLLHHSASAQLILVFHHIPFHLGCCWLTPVCLPLLPKESEVLWEPRPQTLSSHPLLPRHLEWSEASGRRSEKCMLVFLGSWGEAFFCFLNISHFAHYYCQCFPQ